MTAHQICSALEFDLRRPASRVAFPGLRRRAMNRADLAAITTPGFFEYVLNHYVRNIVRRLGTLMRGTRP